MTAAQAVTKSILRNITASSTMPPTFRIAAMPLGQASLSAFDKDAASLCSL
jgi:hypothetical protein